MRDDEAEAIPDMGEAIDRTLMVGVVADGRTLRLDDRKTEANRLDHLLVCLVRRLGFEEVGVLRFELVVGLPEPRFDSRDVQRGSLLPHPPHFWDRCTLPCRPDHIFILQEPQDAHHFRPLGRTPLRDDR
jgi:hypothetical protein